MYMQKHRQSEISNSLLKIMEEEAIFRKVAYFSMEIGLKASIPTYSGGLGVLAGDMLKSAADLGVPMVGVTLLYKNGYFNQTFNAQNWQQENPERWSPSSELSPLPNTITVNLRGREVKVKAWVYDWRGYSNYKVPVYFLDTDLEENHMDDRKISGYLYGGDQTYRICQEMILGVGGLRMLRDLGYCGIETYHLNEGHAGFLTLELMREQGYFSPDKIKRQVIFTTHTPLPAAHDVFPFNMLEKIISSAFTKTLKKMLPDSQGVSMTDLGYHFSRYVNGVSKRHEEIARKMFHKTDVDYITNGVHAETWVSPSMQQLYDIYIPGWREDPARLVLAMKIPKDMLWRTHQANKTRLIAKILELTGRYLNPDILTIGFARRAVQYKRAELVFSDLDRLLSLGKGKVQFVFSGKAHPNDDEGKRILQRLHTLSKKTGNTVPVVFLENYDMNLAGNITQGVDIWLNTPNRPYEASGTSGMKCALNGIPNFSVLDGWWVEGWIEGVTGWAIGPEPSKSDVVPYDSDKDAIDLYDKLEKTIIPLYYENRDQWLNVMAQAIALNGSYFNSHRVAREYCEKAYNIGFRGV